MTAIYSGCVCQGLLRQVTAQPCRPNGCAQLEQLSIVVCFDRLARHAFLVALGAPTGHGIYDPQIDWAFNGFNYMKFSNPFARKLPSPDLEYAAKGYVQVAVVKRHAPHFDLDALEQGYAAELLADGCTTNQHLSARWGGIYAISDDPAEFENGLQAYKDTLEEEGKSASFETVDAANRAYHVAGTLVMGMVHALYPNEYGRFLGHIKA